MEPLYWFVRDLNQLNDRLDTIQTIQQQLTPAVPTPDAKLAMGPSAKAHHGSHSAVSPSAP